MKSSVCADAGLAIMQVLREPQSVLADALWEDWNREHVVVVVPVLWGYEVTSVIRKNAFRKRLSPEDEQSALDAVHRLPVEQMHPLGLHQRAWELARHFNCPVAYDAHYLALAEMFRCPFWTTDERLFNIVHQELPWVHWLGDYRFPGMLHEEQADYKPGSS